MVKELQNSGKENIEGGFVSAIQRERTKIYIEQVRSLEQFQERFTVLIKSYIAPKRLVVFIDDLDRCLPEKAIEVLEAIKLFLDAQNCVFVLGLDQEIIARGIEMKYKELGAKQGDRQQSITIEGIKYLEKIIQPPFQIPPVESADIEDFVKSLNREWPSHEIPRILAIGLGDNPRQIKRTVNVFFMLWKLAEKRKNKLEGRIKSLRLAKLVIIQEIYPELYKLLKRNPETLRELEEYYRSIEGNGGKMSAEIPNNLKNYVEREEIRNILTCGPTVHR